MVLWLQAPSAHQPQRPTHGLQGDSRQTGARQLLEALTASLRGKVFADKSYLSKALLLRLWRQGLHLITGIRRNMKNYLLPMLDKVLLRKR
ncbi:MAG: hypothetical protein F4Y87_07520 [Synechococcus sp. SB0665_bin_28]|nr:hypothetical protein [Synechococcus sp. SB0665_bin_28]MYF20727.1 hypothetical protein [Synechococcus sp. SB0677_bin_5]